MSNQNNLIERAGKTIIDQTYISFIANGLFKGHWLYIEEAAVYIINYILSSINLDSMNLYKHWVRIVNYPEAYIKPSICTLRI